MKWTEGQAAAREQIMRHCDGEPGIYVLAGYAGTGKTTVVTDVLKSIKFECEPCRKCSGTGIYSGHSKCYACSGSGLRQNTVVLAAPTHKAAGVLAEKNSMAHATTSTLAGLVAARPVWTEGDKTFEPRWDDARWPMYQAIVIDEVSMLGQREWGWVLEAQRRWPRHVICMGDPAQLPPVGEDESPAWELVGHELTEVVRHAGEVLDAATRIRERIDCAGPLTRIDAGAHVIRPAQDCWLDGAIEAFDAGVNSRVLAWRNASVDWLNARIRQHFYPDATDAPQEHEPRVVIETWSRGMDMLYAEQVITAHNVRTVEDDGLIIWKYDSSSGIPLEELAPESQAAYSRHLNRLRDLCRANERPWRDYYEASERFVRTRPGYATTVHKSQGSTYGSVWLAERDLARCQNIPLRNRLHYVGVSRTAGELWIV